MRVLLFLIGVTVCSAQKFEHRGYVETDLTAYPRAAPGDSGKAVGAMFVNFEPSYRFSPSLRFSAGFGAYTDTHREVDRKLHLSLWDRERKRPAFAIRTFAATYTRGLVTLTLGKQVIRWGKADILNPTDRFAPRDYVKVVRNEVLGVTATRLTVGTQSDSLDLVWAPRFTPSRTPLLGQRWVVLPELPINAQVPPLDGGSDIPGGPQFGARWNHIAKAAEFSFSYYEGFNHLPLIVPRLESRRLQLLLNLRRQYPQMRMVGADAAIPLRLFTIKTEAAYFTSTSSLNDQYMIYVVQAERQQGEWLFVGGYAGEYVTDKRSTLNFAPDRGLTRAFLGRAGYTIDANRSLALETAVRQDAKGVWVKLEYTQALGSHWRMTGGYTLIRGDAGDFLGQYVRNSFANFALRYSF